MTSVKEIGRREGLRKIANGFHILTSRKKAENMTTRDEDFLAAGVVSWVSQVSFDPAMVMVAIQKGSDLQETVGKSRCFALNTIVKGEKPMLSAFSRDSEINGNKINNYEFEEGQTGSPILNKVSSFIECEIVDEMHTGDHVMYIGKVVKEEVRDEYAEPMCDLGSGYLYGG